MSNIYGKSIGFATAALLLLLGSTIPAYANLIGLYQFNDRSNLGKDTSGGYHDAANNGTTFTSAGYQGGAAAFNGASYLNAPIDANPSALPQFTWGAWVKFDIGGTDGIRAILSADNSGFDRNLNIDSRGGGGTSLSAFTGNGVVASGVAPSTSEWTFIAATYNQTINSMTFYVNSQSSTFSTNFGASHAFFDIGHNPSFGEFFKGTIDNVFIYDEELTASQISTIRSNGFSATVPEPSSLVLLGFGGISIALRLVKQRRTSID